MQVKLGAVDKAIALLFAFRSEGSSGVGVSELSRRVGLSKSTCHRLLASLVENRLVERVGSEYRIGPRLETLFTSQYTDRDIHLLNLATPFLIDLHQMTGETVHLAAWHAGRVRYLSKLYGHQRAPSPSRIGGYAPTHCTAVGKVLLAHDMSGTDRSLPVNLTRRTARTLTDPDVLADHLVMVRRQGLARDDEETQLGLSCVAVPILDELQRPLAAISVSGPPGVIANVKHVNRLREVATIVRRVALAARLHAI